MKPIFLPFSHPQSGSEFSTSVLSPKSPFEYRATIFALYGDLKANRNVEVCKVAKRDGGRSVLPCHPGKGWKSQKAAGPPARLRAQADSLAYLQLSSEKRLPRGWAGSGPGCGLQTPPRARLMAATAAAGGSPGPGRARVTRWLSRTPRWVFHLPRHGAGGGEAGAGRRCGGGEEKEEEEEEKRTERGKQNNTAQRHHLSSFLSSCCSCGVGIKQAIPFGKNLFLNIFLASNFTTSALTAQSNYPHTCKREYCIQKQETLFSPPQLRYEQGLDVFIQDSKLKDHGKLCMSN